jgi:aspartate racemase
MRRPIVIIGGMGPQASVRLHELLLQKSRQHHDGSGDGYPNIVHFSLAVPDFISDPLQRKNARDSLERLMPMIKDLQPSSVLLACNTAHLLITEIPAMRQVPLVSLLETVADRIQQSGATRIGLLASPTTIQTELYESLLAKRGITVIIPSLQEQDVTAAAIREVIAMHDTAVAADNLAGIANGLVARGADAILLGCTELPLLFDASQCAVPVFDCLDIYANSVTGHQYLYNGV